jgi:hypothetical protein
MDWRKASRRAELGPARRGEVVVVLDRDPRCPPEFFDDPLRGLGDAPPDALAAARLELVEELEHVAG